MPTLVLSARHTDDTQRLWRACIAANWEVQRVHGWKVPALSSAEIAVYGEPLFASHVAQTLGLQLIGPSLDWLPQLPVRWRGRQVRLTTLAEARTLTQRAFVKPADEKCFDARVYESGADLPAQGPLPEDLPVLVQHVVTWTVEYRCFVVDRTVATASAYCRNGALTKSEDGMWFSPETELREALQFCTDVLADGSVSIPEAAVIDVGVIENHGWASRRVQRGLGLRHLWLRRTGSAAGASTRVPAKVMPMELVTSIAVLLTVADVAKFRSHCFNRFIGNVYFATFRTIDVVQHR